jgi:hypothetical protein
MKTTQELKKLKLKCYKLYNALTKLTLKTSIYQNFIPLIRGLVILVSPNFTLNLFTLIHLNDVVTLVGVKINNSIYSNTQIKAIIKFEYNQDILNLIKTIKISLRFFKLLTLSRVKNSKQCDLNT